jgi:t-SNARE complex subunit (syntaxin)
MDKLLYWSMQEDKREIALYNAFYNKQTHAKVKKTLRDRLKDYNKKYYKGHKNYKNKKRIEYKQAKKKLPNDEILKIINEVKDANRFPDGAEILNLTDDEVRQTGYDQT